MGVARGRRGGGVGGRGARGQGEAAAASGKKGDLEQQRIASALFNGFLDTSGIRDQKIIANYLTTRTDGLGHLLVSIEVILVKGVLNRHHWIVGDKTLVQLLKRFG